MITHIGSFEARSRLTTWVYAIASRHLIETRKRFVESSVCGPVPFGEWLDTHLADNDYDDATSKVEYEELCAEVRISCTYGVLLCITREARIAYLLGELVGVTDVEGAEILGITRTAFRQRLARARKTLRAVIANRCGLVRAENPCQCSRQIASSVEVGLIDRESPMFAHQPRERERPIPTGTLERAAEQLDLAEAIAELYRSDQATSLLTVSGRRCTGPPPTSFLDPNPPMQRLERCQRGTGSRASRSLAVRPTSLPPRHDRDTRRRPGHRLRRPNMTTKHDSPSPSARRRGARLPGRDDRRADPLPRMARRQLGVLFSHPKDFTPVCTTELGALARIMSECDRRDAKVIGLSVDLLESHELWAHDIEETQGYAPNYPVIADSDRAVSDLYGMIHPNADDTATVRSVFVIGPDKQMKLTITYPMSTGRNFDELLRAIDSLQLTAKHKVSTPANWHPGDDVIIVPAVTDDEARERFPDGWTAAKPYLRVVTQPAP